MTVAEPLCTGEPQFSAFQEAVYVVVLHHVEEQIL